jgi:hypothetical protein
VYWGKGGFTWSDVYDMPVWLRTFYIRSVDNVHKQKAKAEEDAAKKAKAKGSGKRR